MRDPLVLHSSPARLLLSASTPVMLLALGYLARMSTAGTVLIVLGVLLALVVLVDLPVRTEFDEQGYLRVCVLRRRRRSWSDVVAIERMPGRPPLRRGVDPDPAAGAVRRRQGLTARLPGRRTPVLLVDRRESHAEHAELAALLSDRATVLRAGRPPIDSVPAGRGPRALHRR